MLGNFVQELPSESPSTEQIVQFGLSLQQQRLRRGWTMGQLAQFAGISRTTLFQLERGLTSRPQLTTLHKLAQALDISLDELSAPNVDKPYSDTAAFRFDRATNPAIYEVAATHPEVFRHWSPDDWDELYSTMGMGGALTPEGALAMASRINRRRRVVEQLQVVLETHLGEVAVALVERLYQLVQIPGNESIPAIDSTNNSL